MKRRQVLAAATLPLVLWSCASKPKKPAIAFKRINLQAHAREVVFPEAGSARRANIGDVILSTHRVAVVPSVRLVLPAQVDTPYSDKWLLSVKLKQGNYRLVATDDAGGQFFSPMDSVETIYTPKDPAKAPTEGSEHEGGIHVTASGQTSVFLVEEGSDVVSVMEPASGLKFDKGTAEVALPGDALQKDLLFVGASGSVVTLRYRQYVLNAEQKEFSLEVKYDLSQSKSVGYQDARFDITEANNLGISYKVLTPLK